jgi:hypothetical protein
VHRIVIVKSNQDFTQIAKTTSTVEDILTSIRAEYLQLENVKSLIIGSVFYNFDHSKTKCTPPG